MRFGSVGIGGAPLRIIYKAIWVFIVVNSHDAIFDGDSFAGKSYDTLDDVLIANVGGQCTSHGVGHALGFVFGDFGLIFVHKYDDLAAFRDVFLADEMRPRHGGAIDYDTIIAMKGVFHAAAHYIVRAINVSIEKHSTEYYGYQKNTKT